MMENLRTWVSAHALALFLVLTFAISWSWWPLYQRGSVPLVILPLGPMVAALIVVPLAGGWAGIKEWLRTGFKWRIRPIWYIVALAFPLILTALPAGLNILLGATPSTANWPASIMEFLPEAGLILVFVALGEEMGFSAFAQPHLLARRSVLATAGILALVRIVWHLPNFLVGESQWPVALILIPTQLIFTWMFVRTGSALPMILAHFSIAAVGSTYFTGLFSGPELTRVVWLQAGAFLLAGALLLLTSDFWRAGSYQAGPSAEDAAPTTAVP